MQIQRGQEALDELIAKVKEVKTEKELRGQIKNLQSKLNDSGDLHRAFVAAEMDGWEQTIGLGQTIFIILATRQAGKGLTRLGATLKHTQTAAKAAEMAGRLKQYRIGQAVSKGIENNVFAWRAAKGFSLGAWISFAENSVAAITDEVRQPGHYRGWLLDSLATGLAMGVFSTAASYMGQSLERSLLKRVGERYLKGWKAPLRIVGDGLAETGEETVDATLRAKFEDFHAVIGFDQFREIALASLSGGFAKTGVVAEMLRGAKQNETNTSEPIHSAGMANQAVMPFLPAMMATAETTPELSQQIALWATLTAIAGMAYHRSDDDLSLVARDAVFDIASGDVVKVDAAFKQLWELIPKLDLGETENLVAEVEETLLRTGEIHLQNYGLRIFQEILAQGKSFSFAQMFPVLAHLLSSSHPGVAGVARRAIVSNVTRLDPQILVDYLGEQWFERLIVPESTEENGQDPVGEFSPQDAIEGKLDLVHHLIEGGRPGAVDLLRLSEYLSSIEGEILDQEEVNYQQLSKLQDAIGLFDKEILPEVTIESLEMIMQIPVRTLEVRERISSFLSYVTLKHPNKLVRRIAKVLFQEVGSQRTDLLDILHDQGLEVVWDFLELAIDLGGNEAMEFASSLVETGNAYRKRQILQKMQFHPNPVVRYHFWQFTFQNVQSQGFEGPELDILWGSEQDLLLKDLADPHSKRGRYAHRIVDMFAEVMNSLNRETKLDKEIHPGGNKKDPTTLNSVGIGAILGVDQLFDGGPLLANIGQVVVQAGGETWLTLAGLLAGVGAIAGVMGKDEEESALQKFDTFIQLDVSYLDDS
ncbi:MAG: hypothetical protein R3257_04875, partial [bacterium]|nr:hypothetical protein [bacterium]